MQSCRRVVLCSVRNRHRLFNLMLRLVLKIPMPLSIRVGSLLSASGTAILSVLRMLLVSAVSLPFIRVLNTVVFTCPVTPTSGLVSLPRLGTFVGTPLRSLGTLRLLRPTRFTLGTAARARRMFLVTGLTTRRYVG